MVRSASNITHVNQSPTIIMNQSPSEPSVNSWVEDSGPRHIRRHTDASRTRRVSRAGEVASFDPGDWVAQHSTHNSPSVFSSGNHSRKPSGQLSPHPDPSLLSSSPYTDRWQDTSTASIPMSRDTSNTSNVCNNMNKLQLSPMSRGASSTGHSFHQYPYNPEPPSSTSEDLPPTLSLNPAQYLSHTGGVADDQMIAAAFTQTRGLDLIHEDDNVTMQRSSSAESHTSAESRLSRRSQEQATSGRRPIAPNLKATTPSTTTSLDVNRSLPTSQPMSRVSSSSSHSAPVPIPKLPSTRVVREKLMCPQCNEKPDGYKGDHELRRHQKSAHCEIRTVFVCVDISLDQQFLADCKHCQELKPYNAYYNAAAHLRRKHFNPKKKGEKKNGKLSPEERRGGKGGGHWPPMETLKHWLKEFQVDRQNRAVDPADQQYVSDIHRPVTDENVSQMDEDGDLQPAEEGLPTNEVDDEVMPAGSIDDLLAAPVGPPMTTATNLYTSTGDLGSSPSTHDSIGGPNYPQQLPTHLNLDPSSTIDPTLLDFDMSFDFQSEHLP